MMNKLKISFILLLISVAVPWSGTLILADKSDAANKEKHKDEYVQIVVSILRGHVQSLYNLTEEDIKYSDNAARHANGLKHTFDMLGPMDWHAAEAMRLQQENNKNKENLLTHKHFDDMAENSIKKINRLRQSAHRWMRDKDRGAFMKDLDSMMQTCHDCHVALPENTAPKVWMGLKGKH